MANLTTTALVKEAQDIDGTSEDAFIGTLVAAASQMIENICKRTLVRAERTLTYDVCAPYVYGQKLFFREDVISVSAVVDGSGTLDSSKYRLLPPNETIKYGLQLKGSNAWTYTEREEAITVMAVAGDYDENAIPADLRQAATKLAQWMYVTRDSSGDTIRFANGDISIPTDAPGQVLKILSEGRYIKDRLYP